VTKYVNSQTKVDIICKKHGIFEVTPDNHTNSKNGCPDCKKLMTIKHTTEAALGVGNNNQTVFYWNVCEHCGKVVLRGV
jgi:phage FluMu protein Com